MSFPVAFGVFYDFRNPGRGSWERLYQENLEQIRWLDSAGDFDGVSLTEHHFVGDGYSPSTMALATAVCAVTSRLEVTTNIVQLPLHHPLRIAEDALTADIVSGGRFRLGVAVGYRELEFAAFGVPLSERGTRMDEGVEIIRRAFTGEEMSFSGRHWRIPPLTVTPPPVRPGGPPIWIGGTTPRAIERAARLGDGFLASQDGHVTTFKDAASAAGRPELSGRTARTARLLVAADPERALVELGGPLLHQVNQYVEFGFIDHAPYDDPQAVVADGHYEVVDADGALEALARSGEAGVSEFHVMARLPGEPIESGAARLEYLATHVLPRTRRSAGQPTSQHTGA
jgi:alkanesulfonate monooxygenase SsuD/methylene tetrahydromethanopterin reductase-like flavin-dependent oxidoreductase (luciferase family)